MKAVSEKLESILKDIMHLDFLNNYCLVGGTNLAIRFNHRKSYDLDLFINRNFDKIYNIKLAEKLRMTYDKNIKINSISEVGVFCFIDNIKVDFVNYPYKFLKPIENIKGFRLASTLDVAAMKLNAIAGRGYRKDFYDIEKLLDYHSLEEMLNAYMKKYNVDDFFIPLTALGFFDEATDNVISIENKSWRFVKDKISKKLEEFSLRGEKNQSKNRNKGLSM